MFRHPVAVRVGHDSSFVAASGVAASGNSPMAWVFMLTTAFGCSRISVAAFLCTAQGPSAPRILAATCMKQASRSCAVWAALSAIWMSWDIGEVQPPEICGLLLKPKARGDNDYLSLHGACVSAFGPVWRHFLFSSVVQRPRLIVQYCRLCILRPTSPPRHAVGHCYDRRPQKFRGTEM